MCPLPKALDDRDIFTETNPVVEMMKTVAPDAISKPFSNSTSVKCPGPLPLDPIVGVVGWGGLGGQAYSIPKPQL